MKSLTCRILVLVGILSLAAAASAWAQVGCPYAKGQVVPYIYTGGAGWGCGGGCGSPCMTPGYPCGKWKWDGACGRFVQVAAVSPCGPCWSPCARPGRTTPQYSWADAPKGPCYTMRPCWSPCWDPSGDPSYAWGPGGPVQVTK